MCHGDGDVDRTKYLHEIPETIARESQAFMKNATMLQIERELIRLRFKVTELLMERQSDRNNG